MKGKQQMKSKQPASAVSMSAAPRSSRLVEPMTMYNVTQAIELMNREVDPRQYLRETSMNGIESDDNNGQQLVLERTTDNNPRRVDFSGGREQNVGGS